MDIHVVHNDGVSMWKVKALPVIVIQWHPKN